MRRETPLHRRLPGWAARFVALPMAQTSRIEARLRAILRPKRRRTMLTRKTVTVATLATVALIVPLAALRPVALARPVHTAQAAASSAPRPGTVESAPADHPKFVKYDFVWGKIPGDPDRAVAQLRQIYQWGQTYRARHGGAYPDQGDDLLLDIANHPQAYGMSLSDGAGVFRMLDNPDARFAEGGFNKPKVVPFIMFSPRFDGQALGSPKPAGTRDVLAYTPIYVHTNFSHGVSIGQAGFYLVLWDDGTVAHVFPSQKLIVPLAGLSGKSVTRTSLRRAVREGGAEWTFGFPGQAGLPGNTLTTAQARPVGINPY